MFDGNPKTITIYATAEGAEPFGKWLKKLGDGQAVARVVQRLDRLREGNPGDFKEVGQGVYELRIDYGPGYRLYCAFAGTHLIVLLCGGDKRKQDADIQRAHKLWRDYQKRNQP